MLKRLTCFLSAIRGVSSRTSRVEVAVFPSPPLVDVTASVTLSQRPAVTPVTVTVKVQLVPPVKVPPVRTIVPGTEAVVVSTLPSPHTSAEEVAATPTPSGSLSITLMPTRSVETPPNVPAGLGLVMVKVRLAVSPTSMDGASSGLNAFSITGGARATSVSLPYPSSVRFSPLSEEEMKLVTLSNRPG